MDLNKVINGIIHNKNLGGRNYYFFRSLILKLLADYVNMQSKDLLVGYTVSNSIEIDAVAEDGLDDLPGKTIIDIRMDKSMINKFEYIKKFIYISQAIPELKSILFIFGSKLTNDERKLLENEFTSNIKIRIWDIDDISLMFKGLPLDDNYFDRDNLSKFIINDTVTNSLKKDIDQWKESRAERIERLKEIYKRDDLVLFLGAGVSKEAGVPEWGSLISDLMVKMIEEKLKDNNINMNKNEQVKIIEDMKEFNDYSPLLQTSYIKIGLGNSFEKEVAKALYRNFSNKNKGTSPLLKSLAKLCTPPRNGFGIKAVVTYNFDDLLEINLDEKNILYKSIYREIDTANIDELPVYHVHGFLPRNTENDTELSKSLLVFSEDGYHTLYNDPYSWSNIIQLNYLRENTCLMVGLSMTDPNLRRLLSISTRKFREPKHFVIMKRQSFLDISQESGIRKEMLESFTIVNQDLQESFFN